MKNTTTTNNELPTEREWAFAEIGTPNEGAISQYTRMVIQCIRMTDRMMSALRSGSDPDDVYVSEDAETAEGLLKQSRDILEKVLTASVMEGLHITPKEEPSSPQATISIDQEWASALNDPDIRKRVTRLREQIPASLSMPTIIRVILDSWDMMNGEDKLETLNDSLGLDMDVLGMRTSATVSPE